MVCMMLLQLSVHPAAAWTAQHQPSDASENADLMQSHARHLTAFGSKGGGFGGFSRSRAPATSKPASVTRPAQTTRPTTRPAAAAPAAPVAPAGRAFGTTALPGGFNAYGRPGFRSTPFILPLALGGGLLAGSTLAHLNRNPNAYCNGISVQCYKAACEDALRNRCPEAAAAAPPVPTAASLVNATVNSTTTPNTTGAASSLVLSACPDARYSECYRTVNFNNTAAASFECFGVRRPRFGNEDLAAVCHQPGSSGNAAAATAVSKVGALVGGGQWVSPDVLHCVCISALTRLSRQA